MINVKEIQNGDFLSETTYYQVVDKTREQVIVNVIGSDFNIRIDNAIVEKNLSSSDIFNEEKQVTKEDKRDGTLGIRSLFENHGTGVCTVVFIKQNKNKTKKAFEDEKNLQKEKALEKVEKARRGKKSMVDVIRKEIAEIQNNPILPFIPGELRVMTGYKLSFTSRDGKYRFMDLEVKEERYVNINNIVGFIADNTKYFLNGYKNKF